MSGVPKGLLQPPGAESTIVERHVAALQSLGIQEIVIVGEGAAYRHLQLTNIADAPFVAGPLAGLLGLAEFALRRHYDFMLALACDMPNVDAGLLQRLLVEFPEAAALVPRRTHWEPLCARYRPGAILEPIHQLVNEGRVRLSALMDELGAACVALPLGALDEAALDDWDCPGDMPPGVRIGGRLLKHGD